MEEVHGRLSETWNANEETGGGRKEDTQGATCVIHRRTRKWNQAWKTSESDVYLVSKVSEKRATDL